jgi:hypothetical protein
MKQSLFELRSRIGTRQVDVLLAVIGYLHSDGLLTIEELYLLRELARCLQASESWQKICSGEIEFSSETFVRLFRDPERFGERELLLDVIRIVADAKMHPNLRESDYLRRLIAS